MARHFPAFAKEQSAAQLLDMQPAEFRSLVNAGHLPRPRDIAGMQRWDTEELLRIVRGDMIDGAGEINW